MGSGQWKGEPNPSPRGVLSGGYVQSPVSDAVVKIYFRNQSFYTKSDNRTLKRHSFHSENVHVPSESGWVTKRIQTGNSFLQIAALNEFNGRPPIISD